MNLAQRRFLRQLGDRVRERGTALGMTQAELGEKSNLHRTFIGSVERGERNISVLNLRVIAIALRVSPAAFLAPERDSG
jgi:transcriptional regulator with XRE-family HTH domain